MGKLSILIALCFLLASCTDHSEQNDLASAQSCLDNVPEADPTQASACMSYISKYNDQQADILKCAILDTSGGLIESKIVAAYNALQDSTQTNKTASFIAVLSLDKPDPATGYATAQQADQYCQASGVPGLTYISNLIVVGSSLNSTIFSLTGSGIDVSSPSSINSAVTNLLSSCTGASPPASCTSPAMGAAVSNLGQSYCNTPSADPSVCTQVNSAISSTGNDPTKVSQALLCYLNKQTFNASTGQCQ